MSKLEELIQRYCPDGVERKPLVECCNILDGKRKPITKGARQPGPYPYYGANGIQDWVADFIFDGTYVLVGEDGSVITPSGTPVVNWAEGQIWVNNHAHIIAEKPGVLLRYLYFFIQTIDIHNLVHGNIPKLTQGDLKELEIPIPPLPVQEEIVRILNTFTELQTGLIPSLQTELQKRKQQHQYYREKLLTTFASSLGAKEYKMSEICELGTGTHNTQDGLKEGTYPFYTRGVDILRLNTYDFDETAIITAGDGAGVGKVFHYVTGKYALHQRAYRIVPDQKMVLARYLYYYFETEFYAYIMRNSVSSSVTSIRKPMLLDFTIMLPPITEQQKIVDILDRFDALTNDLTTGLPAEIEKRRQQYEYYRDKLLTFKRKEA